MTETTTPPEAVEETPDPATAQCSNCDAVVQRRRPSLTGRHYCPKPDCVKAKQRFYYQQRMLRGNQTVAEIAAERERQRQELLAQRDLLITAFVAAAIQRPRVPCPKCHREDAISGYSHPAPDWQSTCKALKDEQSSLPEGTVAFNLMMAVFPPS